MADGARCEHGNLTEELRSLLDAMAARAEPVLRNVAASRPADAPASCTWCPACASLAVLRGQRPELAVKAAEHAAGLLAVLRTALAEQAPRAAGTAPDPQAPDEPPQWEPPPAARPDRVQRIALRRPGRAD